MIMIKKTFFVTLIYIIVNIVSYAGPLSGEGKGNTVRLFWIPSEWNSNIIGFEIKRKSPNSSNWVKLNESTIIPEMLSDKSLINISNSDEIINKLEKLRIHYMKNSDKVKLTEINRTNYYNLLQKSNSLKAIAILLGIDYNIALMHGFGYIDSYIPEVNGTYSYKLFYKLKSNEEVLADSFSWNYGTKPKYDLELTGQTTNEKNKIIAEWTFDYKKYKKSRILNGFNIYMLTQKETSKMNNNKLWVSKSNTSEGKIVYNINKNKIPEQSAKIIIKPSTIFNTEGSESSIKIYKNCNIKVSVQEDQSKTSKDGIILKINYWGSDKSCINRISLLYSPNYPVLDFKEQNIKIKKDSIILKFIPPKKSKDGYYYFRLKIKGKDGKSYYSNKLSVYNPNKTMKPTGLKSKYLKNGDKKYISFKWNNNDSLQTYNIYKIRELDTIRINKLSELKNRDSAIYNLSYGFNSQETRFGISAKGKVSEESEISLFPKVTIQSDFLKMPYLKSPEVNNNEIIINWDYTNKYHDLKGFYILDKGVIIDKVSNEKRSYKIKNPEEKNYYLSIQAFTDRIKSEKSFTKKIEFVIK